MLFYPSAITLSNRTLDYVARLIRRHRTSIGSRWRRLPSNRQALLVLAHLRNGDTYQRLASGFGIGLATAYRYIRETTDLLAANAPALGPAVIALARSFSNYALLDGTVIRTDRAGDRDRQKAHYSAKTGHHGITLQILTDPYGRLAWVSDGLPGSVYDLTAARTHGILHACHAAGLQLSADRGYIGAGDGVHLPYRRYKNEFTPGQRAANRAHSALRCLVERGIATLKNWRVLTRVRASPHRVTTYAHAILTLEQHTRS
ncbi:transposase [Lentzea chajnantorensis]